MLVTYNGVNLPYSMCNRFDQSAVADPSNTDLTMTRFEVEVLATCNWDYIQAMVPNEARQDNAAPKNAAMVIAYVRAKLMARRERLRVRFNGFDLVPSLGTVDSANGPVPQYCDIVQMDNDTFMVRYLVVAHYVELNDPTNAVPRNRNTPSPVVFNRWKETVDIDDCNFTTKTREGSFRIRSDPANPTTPDQLRPSMAALSIPEGFLRKSSNYSLSEDGLTLHYRITDQEYWKQPPTPSFVADGYYRETGIRPGWVSSINECRTMLKGDNNTRQSQLVNLAIAICASKLDMVGAPIVTGDNKLQAVLVKFVIEVQHYRNVVDVIMVVELRNNKTRVGGVASLDTRMTFVPFSDGVNVVLPSYLDYGTAGILLQAAAYYDPAAGNAALDAGNPFVAGPEIYVTPKGDGRFINQGDQPGEEVG